MIYILDNDTAQIAQALDDRSLSRMISEIAQVLCAAHWILHNESSSPSDLNLPPLPSGTTESTLDLRRPWSQWARSCLANYNYLVELGMRCCEEWSYRFSNVNLKITYNLKSATKNVDKKYYHQHKHQHVIEWAKSNVPDLPKNECTLDSCQKCTDDNKFYYGTPVPLAMPDRFNFVKECMRAKDTPEATINSYRAYYQHNLQKGLRRVKKHSVPDYMGGTTTPDPIIPKWTCRTQPDWLKLEDA